MIKCASVSGLKRVVLDHNYPNNEEILKCKTLSAVFAVQQWGSLFYSGGAGRGRCIFNTSFNLLDAVLMEPAASIHIPCTLMD